MPNPTTTTTQATTQRRSNTNHQENTTGWTIEAADTDETQDGSSA